jgi:hypothetical protein
MRDRHLKEQLRLRKEGTYGRIFRKTVKLETEKRIVGYSTGLRKVTGRCRGIGPLRKERRLKHPPRKRTKIMVYLDRFAPLGKAALRREQTEQLDSNHRENRATKKEGEADHRRHKHSPRRRTNGGKPVDYSGTNVSTATISLQQRNGVFYAVRFEML